MSNKKAQVEDWLPLILTIIVLVIIILFLSFMSLNKNKVAREQIKEQIIVKDAAQLLLNYLKNEVKLEDSSTTAADEITKYFLVENENMLNQIKRITNEFFSNSNIETSYSTWSLEIRHKDKEIIIDSERARREQILRKEISRTIIPAYNTELIELRLFIVTTRFVS